MSALEARLREVQTRRSVGRSEGGRWAVHRTTAREAARRQGRGGGPGQGPLLTSPPQERHRRELLIQPGGITTCSEHHDRGEQRVSLTPSLVSSSAPPTARISGLHATRDRPRLALDENQKSGIHRRPVLGPGRASPRARVEPGQAEDMLLDAGQRMGRRPRSRSGRAQGRPTEHAWKRIRSPAPSAISPTSRGQRRMPRVRAPANISIADTATRPTTAAVPKPSGYATPPSASARRSRRSSRSAHQSRGRRTTRTGRRLPMDRDAGWSLPAEHRAYATHVLAIRRHRATPRTRLSRKRQIGSAYASVPSAEPRGRARPQDHARQSSPSTVHIADPAYRLHRNASIPNQANSTSVGAGNRLVGPRRWLISIGSAGPRSGVSACTRREPAAIDLRRSIRAHETFFRCRFVRLLDRATSPQRQTSARAT